MTCANSEVPVTQLSPEAAERAVLCLINEQRAAHGIPALTLNLKLREAARRHANDAKTIKWWAGGGSHVHINPVTQSTPQNRIKDTDYCPGEAEPPTNENCYSAYYRGGAEYQDVITPSAAVTWWMDSPGHRHTLLDPTYNESGVAVVRGVAERGPEADRADDGGIFVQTFGGCSNPEVPHVGQGWAWGLNNKGQLGDGTTTNQTTPVRPQNLSGVVAVAGGGYHSLALTDDGTVWAWGFNEYGQLGDSTTTNQFTAVQVMNLDGVAAVAGGGYHSLALTNDGTVWAWGLNIKGQLGNGTITNQSEPVLLTKIGGVVAIAAGFDHSLALTTDRIVLAWGNNEYGQLGDDTITNRSTPVEVTRLRDVLDIGSGFAHSLARTGDGTVWAWGSNTSGQLGDGSHTDRLTPVSVHVPNSLSGPIVAITAGGVHNLALEQNGRVWAWGGNAYGQLGNGDFVDRWLPVRPQHMYEVTALAAGFGHNLVLKRDGSVWAWGANYSGQLGDGTTIDRSTQVQVLNLNGVINLACGLHHSLVP